MWPRKVQNVEVNNDLIEVVSVSFDSEVSSVCLSPDSLDYPVAVFPVPVTEYMCVPSCPQQCVPQMVENLRHESSIQKQTKSWNIHGATAQMISFNEWQQVRL